MTRRPIGLTFALATAVALSGCTAEHSPAAPPKTVSVEIPYDELLGQKHVTRDVSLAVGDTFRLTLASTPSTGYRWTAQAQIGDGSVLAQTGHRSMPPGNARPGAPGTEVWTFGALKPGTTTISTGYGQPWPGGAKNTWTFTATTTVS